MSVFGRFGRQLGNQLYKSAFPIYRPLYGLFKSYADRAERQLLAQHLSAGSVVVDAGANIGVYSQFLSHCVGLTGCIHSFEPDPENFAHLKAALAKASNVRLNQLAVSDKTAEAVLHISSQLNVDHRIYPTTGQSRLVIPIRSIRLDDYFEAGERVDLIKMDIQGFELHALRGAARVLAENPGIKLLLEVWPYGLKQARGSAAALFDFLRQAGLQTVLSGQQSPLPDAEDVDMTEDESHYFNVFLQRRL